MTLLPLLTGLLAGPLAAAQTGPAGTWSGTWERDGSTLKVEVVFSRTGAGYEGSFSSAQLRVVAIPFARVTYDVPTLRWELVGDETTMAFEGTLRGDTLAGRFREGAASGTFILTRAPATAASVKEDEVTFSNGSVTLSGTIVSPPGTGPFPGIVFLHGSGAEGRWASRYLAYEFARRGVAALIYDKRGVGRSTGDWRAAGFAELVADAGAAVDALRAQPRVAGDRVGIHGHSQGGTIAPWVATENQHVAFVVGSAAGGVSMADMETYSLENALKVRLMPATEKDLAQRYIRALVATGYEGAPRSSLDRVWAEVRGHPWASEPPPASNFYWAFSGRIADYDPLRYWRGVTVPVLLLYGEADERVPPRLSAARIAESYLEAHGPRLDVTFFPGADHNFRLPREATGRFAWPRTAPGYPERLIEWVLGASKP